MVFRNRLYLILVTNLNLNKWKYKIKKKLSLIAINCNKKQNCNKCVDQVSRILPNGNGDWRGLCKVFMIPLPWR